MIILACCRCRQLSCGVIEVVLVSQKFRGIEFSCLGGVPPDPDDDNFQTMTGGKYVHKVDNDIFSDEFWVTFIKC